jgi:hypothetical protein
MFVRGPGVAIHPMQHVSALIPGGFLIAIGTLFGSIASVWACNHWMFGH